MVDFGQMLSRLAPPHEPSILRRIARQASADEERFKNGMKLSKVSLAVIGAALLTGCASVGVRAHKGAVIDPQLASGIQPGVDNKDSVEKTLGRPSFAGQFNANDWYYVSRDTNQFAFANPKVKEQTVYRVSFDPAGNVVAVQKSGMEMIADLHPSRTDDSDAGTQAQLLRRDFREYRVGRSGRADEPSGLLTSLGAAAAS